MSYIRFDLSCSYWLVAAIAKVDPNKAYVASTAWAKFIVDGDLSHEINVQQIPTDWSTGYVPLGRSKPYQGPLNHSIPMEFKRFTGSTPVWLIWRLD
jgi:purine nucleoside permease